MGSKSSDSCPDEGEERRDTERRWPCGDGAEAAAVQPETKVGPPEARTHQERSSLDFRERA